MFLLGKNQCKTAWQGGMKGAFLHPCYVCVLSSYILTMWRSCFRICPHRMDVPNNPMNEGAANYSLTGIVLGGLKHVLAQQ